MRPRAPQVQRGLLPPTAGDEAMTTKHILRAIQTYFHELPERVGTSSPHDKPDNDAQRAW